jgi:broad specificity phosphatase PhoE
MKHIYLIRHGESESNVDVYEYCNTKDRDIRLTEKGERQCVIAGDFLIGFLESSHIEKIRTFYSPFLRAKQTHDIILEGVPVLSSAPHDLLVEQDYGFDLEKTKEDIDEIMSDAKLSMSQNIYFYKKSKIGESPADVVERIKPFVDEFILNDDGNHVIIVAHGTSIRAISHYLMQANPEEFEYTPKNTAIKKLVVKKGKCIDGGWIYTP